MKNIALILIAITSLFTSCKKEHEIISCYELHNQCSDFKFPKFEKGWTEKQISLLFTKTHEPRIKQDFKYNFSFQYCG
jgi:hypothetical protein|tara:strand:+ start:528 stop:761 length:234 start_codon:yes stop_codon:yes gene_type:complete